MDTIGNRTNKLARAGAVAAAMTAAGLAFSAPALGADEIFLRLDGITGSATAPGYQNEIVLSSYSQAFSNGASASSGSGAGTSKLTCGEIVVTKNIDMSSPRLIGSVVTGSHIASGDIYFDSSRGYGTPVQTYHVALTDVLVTEIRQKDHTPEGVMEQVTLSARQFKFTFTPASANGGTGTPITFSVDCGTDQVT